MKISVFALSLLCFTHAWASAELSALIRCHQGIEERSDGHTTRLTMDSNAETPFALDGDGKIYFITDESISYIDSSAYKGKNIIVELQEKKQPYRSNLSVNNEGKAGGVPSSDLIQDKKLIVKPHAKLDDETLALLRTELTGRWGNLAYACDEHHSRGHFSEAVNDCLKINDPLLQEAVEANRYKCGGGPAKGKKSTKKPAQKKSGGLKTTY
jgi:hypothetical protein